MRSAAKSQARRFARDLRWELVHAAGCVYSGSERCAAVSAVNQETVELYASLCAALGQRLPVVHVPRSLRPKLGATVGGRA
jgi:hypothetical protein